MYFPQNTRDKTTQFTKIICLGLTSCFSKPAFLRVQSFYSLEQPQTAVFVRSGAVSLPLREQAYSYLLICIHYTAKLFLPIELFLPPRSHKSV